MLALMTIMANRTGKPVATQFTENVVAEWQSLLNVGQRIDTTK